VLVTVVVIVAGAMSSNSSSNANSSSTTPANFVATTVPAITSADHVQGNPNATVSLIEYADYECPACAEYLPVVKEVVQNYSSSIRYVFRNFPLYSIHPDAGIAAQAAEAAGLQGKFWEMHDLIYTNQNTWVTATPNQVVSQYFDGYAQSLGLNVDQFNQDVSSTQVLDKIQTDATGGTAAQIDHTPTFFVNLKQIPNPTSYAGFESVINDALAAANATGTTSAAVTSTTK
jgi:protein-disulfide isomerase